MRVQRFHKYLHKNGLRHVYMHMTILFNSTLKSTTNSYVLYRGGNLSERPLQ